MEMKQMSPGLQDGGEQKENKKIDSETENIADGESLGFDVKKMSEEIGLPTKVIISYMNGDNDSSGYIFLSSEAKKREYQDNNYKEKVESISNPEDMIKLYKKLNFDLLEKYGSNLEARGNEDFSELMEITDIAFEKLREFFSKEFNLATSSEELLKIYEKYHKDVPYRVLTGGKIYVVGDDVLQGFYDKFYNTLSNEIELADTPEKAKKLLELVIKGPMYVEEEFKVLLFKKISSFY